MDQIIREDQLDWSISSYKTKYKKRTKSYMDHVKGDQLRKVDQIERGPTMTKGDQLFKGPTIVDQVMRGPTLT